MIWFAAGCATQEPPPPQREECVVEVDNLFARPRVSQETLVFDPADQSVTHRVLSRYMKRQWVEGYLLGGRPRYRPTRVDSYLDDVLDYRVRYSYDAAGSVIRLDGETGQGGRYGYVYTNTYDAQGRLILREGVTSGSSHRIRNSYDAQGRLVLKELDWGGDGGVDETYRYTYDARGLLAGRGQGGSAENPFIRWSFGRDASGRLVRAERDGGGLGFFRPDGRIDIRMTWTWGDSGSVAVFEQDGTDARDSPYTDGLADVTRRYSGCRAVGTMVPEIYRFEDEEPEYRR